MSEGGFLQQKPRSPANLTVVIALHAVVLGALAMAKMDMPVMKVFEPLKIHPVAPPPEPPPVERKVEPERKPKPAETPRVTYREPIVPLRIDNDLPLNAVPTVFPPIYDGIETAARVDPPARPLPPPSPPVRTEAQIASNSIMQPAYPGSEERAGTEGSVTIRVLIGTDGRVKSVEKIRAASDAFFRSTERHALRHWRFRPATLDGKPVESSKIMTVHFQLQG